MDFTTILDISSIIWNKADYDANTSNYYRLAPSILILFDKLENQDTKFLLREQLLSQMVNGFPAGHLPAELRDFIGVVYSFLAKIGSKLIDYPDSINPNLVSIPDLIKDYYEEDTKQEVKYLISRIHSRKDDNRVYFSFEYLWDGNDSGLSTIDGADQVSHETIISDKDNELDKFLDRFRRIFEHHEKHDRKTGHKRHAGADVAPLSCFDGTDTTVPQRLLDTGEKFGNCIYNYDDEYEIWVVFRNHEANKYHAHDEVDFEKIPLEARKNLNKDK